MKVAIICLTNDNPVYIVASECNKKKLKTMKDFEAPWPFLRKRGFKLKLCFLQEALLSPFLTASFRFLFRY